MSFLTMLDEITLESLMEEQFDCFIEYYHENYPEDFKSDLENLEEIYKMMNGGVEYPRTQNASPSEIKEPYEPSPRMYSYEQPSCLGSTFVGETLRKSDQLHQTFKKSSIAMTCKLDDMIELPKSQPKRTYNEDLECEIVMVKMPKCLALLDDEPIGDIDTMEDKAENLSPQRTPQVLLSFEVIFDEKKLVGGRFNQLSHVSSPLLSKPGEYSRKAYLLEDKQIPSVGVFDEVFSTWMTFGGNTRDLGSFGEETDKTTTLHQILEEVGIVKLPVKSSQLSHQVFGVIAGEYRRIQILSSLDAYDEPIGDIEDKVDNPSPQSTPQVLLSFEVYTSPVTYSKEAEETIGISIEVEPLDHTKLEDLGLNTCSHDLFPSSRKFHSVDELEPQPLPNLPFLDVNLGGKRGIDPPINLYSLGSFRMKEITNGNLREGIFEEKKKNSSLQTLETASGLVLTASPGLLQENLIFN
ncbi:hypothetical protein Tco_1235693 [Tanacetum coccineum]